MSGRGNYLRKGELSDALGAFRRTFYVVGGFSFAINLLLLAPAIYMLQMYDRVLTSRNEGTLILLSVLLVAMLALQGALDFLRSRVLVRATAALDLRLGERAFDVEFERALAGRRGDGGDTIVDLGRIRQFLTGKGLFAFFDAPWTPVFLLVIFLLHPWLGIFALVAALILFGLAWANERATAPLVAESGRLGAAAGRYAGATLANAEVIEALGMLPRLRARWFALHARYLAYQSEAADRASAFSSGTRGFRILLQSAILGAGAYLVLQGQLTAGGMIAASILLGRTLAPVDLAIATWRSVISARQAYERLDSALAAHPARTSLVTLPRPEGAIAADGLVVAPPGSREPILKGIGFRVPAGGMVAIVGPSAAGKSTLARALVGVWTPLAGTLRLDGADIHGWDKAELGPHLGYLPQDIELFDGSIAENIARFGEVDSEAVLRAARKAGVHEMVLQLPAGYDTPIGPGGSALSGGQRQRIGLARALYGEPTLVVLDEPNSNLDDAGDAALLAALRALKDEKRTVFIVTHRVNLLRLVDAVLVLADGRVRAFGPRDEVLKAQQARVAGAQDKLPADGDAA